jgi:hypothetical protein
MKSVFSYIVIVVITPFFAVGMAVGLIMFALKEGKQYATDVMYWIKENL